MSTKINLNDVVKFKLTNYGKDIYFRKYDELNERLIARGLKPLEPSYPKVDENGYSKMQLWSFIELYGNYIGLTKPNVIEPLDLIVESEVE